MRTLILYSSKYGFTERVAKILADHIDGDVVVERCVKDYSVDLTKFDNVIMGSSIYVGKPNIALLDFCDSYQRLLMNKKIGFFVTSQYFNFINEPDEATFLPVFIAGKFSSQSLKIILKSLVCLFIFCVRCLYFYPFS